MFSEFLRWLWWKTHRSCEVREEPVGTLLSVLPSSATLGRPLAGSLLLSPMHFRCLTIKSGLVLVRCNLCSLRFKSYSQIFVQKFNVFIKFPGFLQDDKVEPKEEADEVCNRLAQPGGNWAGSQEWAGHWVLTPPKYFLQLLESNTSGLYLWSKWIVKYFLSRF